MQTRLADLLESLNHEQQSAVYAYDETILVCAGAGSGKTRIIIARIAYLIHIGVAPDSIIAVTFTNKAAREMKERLASVFPNLHPFPYIGTFHGLCLLMLKKYRTMLGINDFSLLDESDQRKLIHSIIKRSQLDTRYKPRSVASYISHRKNTNHSNMEEPQDDALEAIYRTYEHEKRNAHCYDFDDLLCEVVGHLRNNRSFRQALHNAIHHILVDEYQDTNHIQHELLRYLACYNGTTRATSICVVGDEDQSIYRWRGATVENFVAFDNDFPEAKRITITQNYRSAQPILHAANTVIHNNTQRHSKSLWSDKSGQDRICVLQCSSHVQEGYVIAYVVQHIIQSGHQPAILYRSHYQSRAIEEALVRNNIPYTIIGGTEFYQRQEIKDILAYLKLLVNPYDHISWSRICNTPHRSLGAKFQEQFLTMWRNEPLSDHITIANTIRYHVGTRKARSLDAFLGVFEGLAAHQAAYEVCNYIIERTQYRTYLQETCDEDEASEKLENITELQRSLSQRPDVCVQEFLEEITLMQQHYQEHSDAPQAYLMTLHAAKGLEFHTIILAGLEEYVFPSMRSRYNDDSLEEERRLFYVGLTRSCERVVITYAQYRTTFGTMNDNPPSRFISELPHDTIRHESVTRLHDTHIRHFIQRWLSHQHNDQTRLQQQPRPTQQRQNQNVDAVPTPQTWHIGQSVWHPQFGAGTIRHVSYKSSDHIYVTVRFATGIKKLDAQYVSSAY